jgi:hypothetical protein
MLIFGWRICYTATISDHSYAIIVNGICSNQDNGKLKQRVCKSRKKGVCVLSTLYVWGKQ